MWARNGRFIKSNNSFSLREILQDSDLKEFQVKKNDIIVLSSDGLYDVVTDSDIEKIVNSFDERVSFTIF
jgi:serine/threonine protein phosphatase PrpC